MRRAHVVVVIAVGCAGSVPTDPDRRYLRDGEFRRAELVASLVDPTNAYSRTRIARYSAWQQLPEWNPPVAPVERHGARHALAIEDARSGDRAALVALGEAAFFAYPAQHLPPNVPIAGYGATHLVEVEMADGTTGVAYTCATCHAAEHAGRTIAGLANDRLDIGRWLADAAHDPDSPARAWGPGRVDVSSPTKTEPVRIPDLRATRYQTHLQINATVRQRNIASLALRIETLLVTAHGEIVRPPHEVALGLAYYLWSLAPAPTIGAETGRAIFASTCSRCHPPPTFAGPPVPLDAIGADAIGRSAERGTGTWRTPSLLGVADRRLLLHDGAATTFDELLELHAPTVADSDRDALVTFLRSL
jgi:mono/diheme cytochrome c family protein